MRKQLKIIRNSKTGNRTTNQSILQKHFFGFLIAVTFYLGAAEKVHAQAGGIDTSFNSTDIGFGNGDGANNTVWTTSVLSDGKIIIGGFFTSYNGAVANGIARLNIDGTLDPGFNTGTGANNGIYATAIQTDGKIIIGGTFTNYNGTAKNYIARLDTNGSLDTTFNKGTGNGTNYDVRAIAIQADGKILIGGDFGLYDNMSTSTIARLNIDGSLDTSFKVGSFYIAQVNTINVQNNGKIIAGGGSVSFSSYVQRLNANGSIDSSFNFGIGANNTIYTTAVQSNGKVIIGGAFTTYNGVTEDGIVRVDTNGSIDNSFITGSGFYNFSDSIWQLHAVAIQTDGKIIIGGNFLSYNGMSLYSIARLDSNGTVDGTFNEGEGANSNVQAIVLQSNGQIIIGGDFESYKNISRIRAARINTDGSNDLSFNTGSGADNLIETSLVQNDGKIFIGGNFLLYNGVTNNELVRINTNGKQDTSFKPVGMIGASLVCSAIQNDGKILIGYDGFSGPLRLNTNGTLDSSFNAAKAWLYGISVQSDGKILIGGNHTGINHCIARLNTDGSSDTTFNPGGGGANIAVYTMQQLGDGKIIIGGLFTSYNGTSINGIARLNANGTLDASFNPGSGLASNTIYTSALQSDGKIIIGGDFNSYNGTPVNCIARINTNGTIDTSFKIGTGANNLIWTITLQSDGRIIAGGEFTSFNGTAKNYIVRLNTDGSIDTSFNIGTGASGLVYTTAIQSDNKIIMGGAFTSYNGTGRNRVARLLNNPIMVTSLSPLSPFCVGSGISVQYIANITFNAGNVFTAQLSNANGSFASPVNIGTLASTISGIIDAAIPSNTPAGAGYRIRVVSSNPAATGSDNGSNLTINAAQADTVAITLCAGDSLIVGSHTYKTSGTYIDTLTTVNGGCDSVVTTQFTVSAAITDSITATLCEGDSEVVGSHAYKESGIYHDTLTAASGCDSIVTISLTVNPVPITNFSIYADTAQLHHYLVTDNSYGTPPLSYLWSWGDGLPDDTSPYPSHTYADTGFYTICLTITDSTGCQSTFCDSSFDAQRTTNTMVYVNVVNPNIATGTQAINSPTPEISIYPNPATNQLTIHIPILIGTVMVSVVNVLGQSASPTTPLQGERGADTTIYIGNLPAGMYFLQMKTESGSVVKRFVKE